MDNFTPAELKGMDLSQIDLSDVYNFIDHGDRAAAPPQVLAYLQVMEKVRTMNLRVEEYGSRDLIIKHLVKVDGFSPYMAGNIYDDAIQYFYSERNITRDAWRNLLAEKMYKNINLAIATCKDPKDLININKSIADISKVLRLDQPDPIELKEDEAQPWIIYTTDAEMLGIEEVSRTALKKQIEAIPDISEKARDMIKRHAGVLPVKVFLDKEENAYED